MSDYYIQKRLDEQRQEIARKTMIVDAKELCFPILKKIIRILTHLNQHELTKHHEMNVNDGYVNLKWRNNSITIYTDTLENSFICFSDWAETEFKKNAVSVYVLEDIYKELKKEFKTRIEKQIIKELVEKRYHDIVEKD